jgi:hypothetical protein
MAGPTPGQIEHYVRMFEQLSDLRWCIGETLCWTVVRPHQGRLSVDEVVSRLHSDPETMTTYRPADLGYDEDTLFIEQRDNALIIVGCSAASVEGDALVRLSRGAIVHGVFWLVNNFNRLYHAVDGVVVTELDVLRPVDRWGADPEALSGHLDALRELHDDPSPGPDWQTAMATVESLTGVRLDADWFHRPQLRTRVDFRW